MRFEYLGGFGSHRFPFERTRPHVHGTLPLLPRFVKTCCRIELAYGEAQCGFTFYQHTSLCQGGIVPLDAADQPDDGALTLEVLHGILAL